MNKLSPDARLLLESMRNGKEVIIRATTGRPDDDNIHTNWVIELKKAGLIEIGKIDKRVGWVWYVPTKTEE